MAAAVLPTGVSESEPWWAGKAHLLRIRSLPPPEAQPPPALVLPPSHHSHAYLCIGLIRPHHVLLEVLVVLKFREEREQNV